MIAAIYHPATAAVTASVYIIGRIMYALGYTIIGLRGRLAGVIQIDLAMLVIIIVAFISIFMWKDEGDDGGPNNRLLTMT